MLLLNKNLFPSLAPEEEAPKIPKSDTQSTFDPDLGFEKEVTVNPDKEKVPQIPKSETQSTFNPDLGDEEESFTSP